MIEVKSYRDLTVLLIVQRLGYLKPQQLEPVLNKCDEIGKMLYTLMEKLGQKKKINQNSSR